jgi:hypothetical protein
VCSWDEKLDGFWKFAIDATNAIFWADITSVDMKYELF